MNNILDAIDYIEKGDFINARIIAEKILADEPNNRYALQLLSIACRNLGESTKAGEILRRARNIPLPKSPTKDEAEILWRLTQITSKLQKNIYAVNPQALAYANMGAELCKLGKPNEGKSYFQKSIRIDHNCELAHYNLGLLEYNQKDFQACIKSMREVIRINPNNLKAKEVLSELGEGNN
jgi:tetratricopeptide (TPR) repeat protein